MDKVHKYNSFNDSLLVEEIQLLCSQQPTVK
jgi:hypothetical protein